MVNDVSKHFLRITIPIHLLAIVAISLIGLRFVTPHWLFATLLGWFLISGFGIAIGFHRYFSHNAFQTYPIIEKILAYLGCLGAQGSPIFWTALHNGSHHRFSDTAKDIHSPFHGKWHAYMGWQIYLKPEEVPFRYGAALLKKKYLKFLHKNYTKIFWASALVLALVDWRVSLYGLLLPSFISIHQENIVDLFCHLRSCGYRNYETKDNSVNVPLVGLLAFGQGWHNNHHARPRDYNFGGNHWWEIDICSLLVPLISKSQTRQMD